MAAAEKTCGGLAGRRRVDGADWAREAFVEKLKKGRHQVVCLCNGTASLVAQAYETKSATLAFARARGTRFEPSEPELEEALPGLRKLLATSAVLAANLPGPQRVRLCLCKAGPKVAEEITDGFDALALEETGPDGQARWHYTIRPIKGALAMDALSVRGYLVLDGQGG